MIRCHSGMVEDEEFHQISGVGDLGRILAKIMLLEDIPKDGAWLVSVDSGKSLAKKRIMVSLKSSGGIEPAFSLQRGEP